VGAAFGAAVGTAGGVVEQAAAMSPVELRLSQYMNWRRETIMGIRLSFSLRRMIPCERLAGPLIVYLK